MKAVILGMSLAATVLAGQAAGQNPGEQPGTDQTQRDEETLKAAGLSVALPDLLDLIDRPSWKAVDPNHLAESIRALGSADFKEREKASREIMASGCAAVPALRAALRSADAEVVRRATDCLGNIEAHKGLVLAAVRVAISRLPVEALRTALKSKDADVRKSAVDALEPLGTKAAGAVPLLLEALDDLDDTVGHAARETIRSVIRLDQLPLVLAAAKDRRVKVRTGALYQFNWPNLATEPKRVMPVLLEALRDESAAVRRRAAASLVCFGSEKETVPALIKALKDPDQGDANHEAVASNAVLTLAYLGGQGQARQAIPALVELARSGRRDSRGLIMAALGIMGNGDEGCFREVFPILVGFLKSKEDPLNIACAAHGLDKLRTKAAKAVPDLVQALDTKGVKDPALARRIRVSIIVALEGIGPEAADAVPALIRVLQSTEPDADERRHAIGALGAIGPAAKAAIPVLRKFIGSVDSATLWQAQHALRLINR